MHPSLTRNKSQSMDGEKAHLLLKKTDLFMVVRKWWRGAIPENVIWYDKALGPSGYGQITYDFQTNPFLIKKDTLWLT